MDLIDRAEVKKRYPIMENDFGMVVNEGLHKELDKIPTVDAVPMSVIEEIKAEITRLRKNKELLDEQGVVIHEVIDIIDRKVKEHTEVHIIKKR